MLSGRYILLRFDVALIRISFCIIDLLTFECILILRSVYHFL